MSHRSIRRPRVERRVSPKAASPSHAERRLPNGIPPRPATRGKKQTSPKVAAPQSVNTSPRPIPRKAKVKLSEVAVVDDSMIETMTKTNTEKNMKNTKELQLIAELEETRKELRKLDEYYETKSREFLKTIKQKKLELDRLE